MAEQKLASTPPPSSRRQPQRIPPPVRSGTEPFEGEPILGEIPSDLGLLLWRTARSIQLWAALDGVEGSRAFGTGAHTARLSLLQRAEVPIELLEPLVVAAAVLKGEADRRAVADACVAVKEWATRSSKLTVALEFAQASALLVPQEPSLNCEVGRLAVELGDSARGEGWYRQAMVAARRTREWWWYAHSNLALSALFRAQGDGMRARRHALLALRSASRHSLRDLAAGAHLGIVASAIEGGRGREVVLHADRLLDVASEGDPRILPLALLLTHHWIEQRRVRLAEPVGDALAEWLARGGPGAEHPGIAAVLSRLAIHRSEAGDSPEGPREPRSPRELRALAKRLAGAIGALPTAAGPPPTFRSPVGVSYENVT